MIADWKEDAAKFEPEQNVFARKGTKGPLHCAIDEWRCGAETWR
jgi:hypothetical protein